MEVCKCSHGSIQIMVPLAVLGDCMVPSAVLGDCMVPSAGLGDC